MINGELTQTELQVFFTLLDEIQTQTAIAKNSNIPLASVKRAVKILLDREFIKISKIEGKNKFLTANIEVNITDKDQIKLKI